MTATVPGLGPTTRRPTWLDPWAVAVGALAAVVVGGGLLLGWRGVDLPAQLYRIDLFRRQGFALWDSQWFGGHWLLDYSVLFPAVAASVGVGAVTVLSAVLATVAFDRLIVDHFGRSGRMASAAFALGITAQSAIGQLTFLGGEAAGLWCLVLVARRRWTAAAVLGAASALTSPLAGAFVALAIAALWLSEVEPVNQFSRVSWWSWVGSRSGFSRLSGWSRLSGFSRPGLAASGGPSLCVRPGGVRRWIMPAGGMATARGYGAVLLAIGIPVVAVSAIFPGQGAMPYPFTDYLWELAIAGGLWVLTPRTDRILRVGLVVYAAAVTFSEAVPTPLGGNIGRLEDCAALALAVALLWPQIAARRTLLAVVAVPLILSQWSPAWTAMTSNSSRAWTHAAYYQPVVAFLRSRPGPAGRIEVVPTADHWEAAYVAPSLPLARGWERQLDLANNPLFYGETPFNAVSYRAWLLDNGVRFVARPHSPLDVAGTAEGKLVARRVPGLTPVWHNHNWTVYEVAGSTGIVGPGGHLVRLEGSQLTIAFDRPGTVVVRVRYSPSWRVNDPVPASAAGLPAAVASSAAAGPPASLLSLSPSESTASHSVTEAAGGWLAVTSSQAGVVQLRVSLL